MNNILLVIDMQNDFVRDALKNKQAEDLVPDLVNEIKNFDGKVFFTKDTHYENYLETQEGKNLPVAHCIKGTAGHNLVYELQQFETKKNVIEKDYFGSVDLGKFFKKLNKKEKIDSITVVGTCTEICVVSNVLLLKAFLPETKIKVIESLCAGLSAKGHFAAIDTMRACQVEIIKNN